MQALLSRAALYAVSALALACASTTSSMPTETPAATQWLEPSAPLKDEIEKQASRLPYAERLDERIDLITWFAGVGEPAYPTLLELSTDARPKVAGTALAALGATRDPRLIEPVRALELNAAEADLDLEKARALLMLGDWSGIPVLIDGLRDDRLYTRAICASALRDATRMGFEFDPTAEDGPRAEAIARWEDWWERRSGDSLLGS